MIPLIPFSLVFGLLHASLHVAYSIEIDDDFDLSRANEDRQQGFWYSDDEILDRGFSSKDIKKIIKVVYKNLVDMSPFKIYQISDVDKLVKKN